MCVVWFLCVVSMLWLWCFGFAEGWWLSSVLLHCFGGDVVFSVWCVVVYVECVVWFRRVLWSMFGFVWFGLNF